MNQASRKSWLVPVLPAAVQPGMSALRAWCRSQWSPHHGVHHRDVAWVDHLIGLLRLVQHRAPCCLPWCGLWSPHAVRRPGRHWQRSHRRDNFGDRDFRRCRAQSRDWPRVSRKCRAMRGAHHVLRPDLDAEPHRDRVERHGERLGQRHRAEIFMGVVLGRPALDVERCVLADGLGVRPASSAVR